MTDLTQFNFHGNGVRVVANEQGEPQFVAGDVCDYFGVTNRNRVMQGVDPDDKGGTQIATPGGTQTVTTINESGLYSLLFALQPQKARGVDDRYVDERLAKVREFKRWVTHEVLPSIRKSGSYGTPQLTGRELMAHALVEAQSVIEAAEKRVKELEPSAHSWDTLVADTAGDWSMRDAAQILARDPEIQIGQNRLAKLLRQIRWIDSRGIPYQPQIDNGRLMSKPQTRISHRTGERVACDPQVRITLKGLSWLHQHLGGVAELQTDAPMLAAVGS